MSEVRDRFEQAARNGDWATAFLNMNGLSMYEMLLSLAGLPQALADELRKRSSDCWSQVNMPRIAFAMAVERQRTIPKQIPDDVTNTGQVDEAKRFLAQRAAKPKTPPPTPPTQAGHPFTTADSAAIAAIDEVLPLSVANNWEYAGRVYRDPGGTFRFTTPTTLKSDRTSDPGPKLPGSVATFHTHAGGFFQTDEQFSPDDKWKATAGREAAYLGTPRGAVLLYVPVTLLPQEEQASHSMGKVETLRAGKVICR